MARKLPEKFVRIITKAHGAKGAEWLAELPGLIWEIEERWSLEAGKPFQNLSYNYVAPCSFRAGGEAVLKIGFPEENSPVLGEAETLKFYNGSGAAKLLRIDEENLTLLLEKLNPGKHLKDIFQNDKAKSVEIAIEVLQKIRSKPPEDHNFIRLEDWFANFGKARNTNFPSQAVSKAQKFYEELSTDESFLLHGDFHHENVLSASREAFLAIDPKGVIGQIGYEISVFLNDHAWWLEGDDCLREKLNDALLKFSEAFEIEAHALRKWAYAQGVLSAWWTFEENRENWKSALASVEVWEV
jgi:streptomycin 6-kinase